MTKIGDAGKSGCANGDISTCHAVVLWCGQERLSRAWMMSLYDMMNELSTIVSAEPLLHLPAAGGDPLTASIYPARK